MELYIGGKCLGFKTAVINKQPPSLCGSWLRPKWLVRAVGQLRGSKMACLNRKKIKPFFWILTANGKLGRDNLAALDREKMKKTNFL